MPNLLRKLSIVSVFALAAAFSGLPDTARASTLITSGNVLNELDDRIGREVRIKQGQEVELKAEKLRIKFVSLISDSRCPKDVTCIWGGDAEILLTVRRAKSRPKYIRLHTSNRFEQEKEFGGYVISLTSLEPYPTSKGKRKSKEYVATLSVKKR